MKIGSKEHKNEWAEEQIKNAQESMWVADVSMMPNDKLILAKKKELERIAKRIEEKFYPSARDGKEDKANREMEFMALEGNRERMLADRKKFEEQIEAVREFMKAE